MLQYFYLQLSACIECKYVSSGIILNFLGMMLEGDFTVCQLPYRY